jgi:hypothetical protein
MEHGWNVRIN